MLNLDRELTPAKAPPLAEALMPQGDGVLKLLSVGGQNVMFTLASLVGLVENGK